MINRATPIFTIHFLRFHVKLTFLSHAKQHKAI